MSTDKVFASRSAVVFRSMWTVDCVDCVRGGNTVRWVAGLRRAVRPRNSERGTQILGARNASPESNIWQRYSSRFSELPQDVSTGRFNFIFINQFIQPLIICVCRQAPIDGVRLFFFIKNIYALSEDRTRVHWITQDTVKQRMNGATG